MKSYFELADFTLGEYRAEIISLGDGWESMYYCYECDRPPEDHVDVAPYACLFSPGTEYSILRCPVRGCRLPLMSYHAKKDFFVCYNHQNVKGHLNKRIVQVRERDERRRAKKLARKSQARRPGGCVP